MCGSNKDTVMRELPSYVDGHEGSSPTSEIVHVLVCELLLHPDFTGNIEVSKSSYNIYGFRQEPTESRTIHIVLEYNVVGYVAACTLGARTLSLIDLKEKQMSRRQPAPLRGDAGQIAHTVALTENKKEFLVIIINLA
jgi:hypothetical protein